MMSETLNKPELDRIIMQNNLDDGSFNDRGNFFLHNDADVNVINESPFLRHLSPFYKPLAKYSKDCCQGKDIDLKSLVDVVVNIECLVPIIIQMLAQMKKHLKNLETIMKSDTNVLLHLKFRDARKELETAETFHAAIIKLKKNVMERKANKDTYGLEQTERVRVQKLVNCAMALVHRCRGNLELSMTTFTSKRRAEQYFLLAAIHFQNYIFDCYKPVMDIDAKIYFDKIIEQFKKCRELGKSCVTDQRQQLIIERFALPRMSGADSPGRERDETSMNNQSMIFSDFSLHEDRVLGEGGYGIVFVVEHKSTRTEFACKKILPEKISLEKLGHVYREIGILKELDHPNIVSLQAVYYDKRQVYLVMELCAVSDLLKFLKKTVKDVLTGNEAKHFITQMILAVRYIHQHHIIHCDIKVDNFLLQCDPSVIHELNEISKFDRERRQKISSLIPKLAIKLTDFGLSKYSDEFEEITLKGTLPYLSPQVFKEKKCDKASDTWALGISAFLLLYGFFPFTELVDGREVNMDVYKELINQMLDGESAANKFLKRFLDPDSTTRITLDEALDDPFLKDSDPIVPMNFPSHSATSRQIPYNAAGSIASTSFPYPSLAQIYASPKDRKEIFQSLVYFLSMSSFAQLMCKAAAFSLTQSEISSIRTIFNEIDINRNGSVDMNELRDFLSRNNVMSLEDVSLIESNDFKFLSGVTSEISYSVFIAATLVKTVFIEENHLRMAFERLDQDGDGHLSYEGMRKAIGEKMSEAEIETLFLALDKDKSGTIDYDEFLSYWRCLPVRRNRPSFYRKLYQKLLLMCKVISTWKKTKKPPSLAVNTTSDLSIEDSYTHPLDRVNPMEVSNDPVIEFNNLLAPEDDVVRQYGRSSLNDSDFAHDEDEIVRLFKRYSFDDSNFSNGERHFDEAHDSSALREATSSNSISGAKSQSFKRKLSVLDNVHTRSVETSIKMNTMEELS